LALGASLAIVQRSAEQETNMTWHLHNLTTDSGAPRAIDDPRSHVVDVPGAQPTQHVFYRSGIGVEHPHEALVELWWAGSDRPHWGDLFAQVGGEAALLSLPPFASHVEADGTQHVFYEGGGTHLYELWWKGNEAANAGDLMIASGEPLVGGSGLTSYVFQAEGTQHVFFNAIGTVDGEPVDHHVGELWWRGSEAPHFEDLTKRSRTAPLSSSALASNVFDDGGRAQHVFYLAGRDVFELSWSGGEDPLVRNLTDRSSGEPEPAVNAPASHVFENETQHVFYTADNAHIIEMSWAPGQDPVARDLTRLSRGIGPAPLAASAPTSHVFDQEGTHHVYYVADNGNVIEMWWADGDEPNHENLTLHTGGAPLATRRPTSHVHPTELTQHVFYKSTHAEIIELWWEG
jgi:hypothetical protein